SCSRAAASPASPPAARHWPTCSASSRARGSKRRRRERTRRGSLPMRMIAALAGRDLRRFFRQPSRIVGSAAPPFVLWAVLGAGLAGSSRPGGGPGVDYLQSFYPGVVVLTLLFTAIFSTISVIEDRHHGFLQAVLAAPVSRVGLVLGKSLGGVAIATVQVAILLLLAPLA